MTRKVAERAIRMVTDADPGQVVAAGAGMSSEVWKGEAGGAWWAVRIPIPGSGRRSSYGSERLIGEMLSALLLPVALWTMVEVDGVVCSVAPWLPGEPINPVREWTETFAAGVAAVLAGLHRMPTTAWGPLKDNTKRLEGISSDPRSGVVDRWFHAAIWPFDRSSLADHPVAGLAPELVPRLDLLGASIMEAADGNRALAHSDLHPQHLLQNRLGELSGVLDFGDAFIGSAAWDFALLTHYYGPATARLVALHYPNGLQLAAAGKYLAVAVSMYKLAKAPQRVGLVEPIQYTLDAI